MTQDGNILRAEEGKTLVRIADGYDYGNKIYLGYSHYIGGILQTPPHKDEPSDFLEVEIEEDINGAE